MPTIRNHERFMSEKSAEPHKQLITAKLREDINRYLEGCTNHGRGLKELSLKSGLSEKTLRRYWMGETFPQKKALSRIYTVLYRKNINVQMPAFIENEIKKLSSSKTIFSVEKELTTNSIFRKICILSSFKPLYREYVSYRFGIEGVRILESMVEHDFLQIMTPSGYRLNRAKIIFNEDMTRLVTRELVDDFLDGKKSNSFACLFAGLSDGAYQKIIAIQKRSMREISAVLSEKSCKGDIPFWHVSIVDTMSF